MDTVAFTDPEVAMLASVFEKLRARANLVRYTRTAVPTEHQRQIAQ
jgi:hypothetical protein